MNSSYLGWASVRRDTGIDVTNVPLPVPPPPIAPSALLTFPANELVDPSFASSLAPEEDIPLESTMGGLDFLSEVGGPHAVVAWSPGAWKRPFMLLGTQFPCFS